MEINTFIRSAQVCREKSGYSGRESVFYSVKSPSFWRFVWYDPVFSGRAALAQSFSGVLRSWIF
jgi:hypothetical protein